MVSHWFCTPAVILPCINVGDTVQESGIWSILPANNLGKLEKPGIHWGLGFPHTSGQMSNCSPLCVPNIRDTKRPRVCSSPWGQFQFSWLCCWEKILNIQSHFPSNPIYPTCSPKRILLLFGVFSSGNFKPFLMLSYNYSSADLHKFHMCQQTGKTHPEWIHSTLNHFPELPPALFHCIWCLSCKMEIPNCRCRMDIPLSREERIIQ